MRDWQLDNTVLLVGAQVCLLHLFVVYVHSLCFAPTPTQKGTGKNKLVDHLVRAMNRERVYIQLHRDTSLASLTVVPTLVAGRLVMTDSPVLDAVRAGRVLVVDEADKAPREVGTSVVWMTQNLTLSLSLFVFVVLTKN